MISTTNVLLAMSLLALVLAIVIVAKQGKKPASEWFALSRPNVVNSTNDVDLTKWYYPGKRVKDITIKAGKNTSQTCGPQFPDKAWKLAAAVAPECTPEDDTVYTFDENGEGVRGMFVRPFNIKHASGRQRCLRPWGAQDAKVDEINASWADNACSASAAQLYRGADGVIRTGTGMCLYASRNGTENNDILHFGKYCDQAFDFKNGRLFHRYSGKCVHPRGGTFEGNDQDAVLHSDNCGVGMDNQDIQARIGVDMSTDGINQYTLNNNGEVISH